MSDEFLSVAAAAEILGVSTDHVRRYAPLIKLGRRTLVPGSWLSSLSQPPATADAQDASRRAQKPASTRRVFEFPK